MMHYEKTKKSRMKIKTDWIKPIHRYRLVNIGWLADINLFDSMI